MDTAIFYKFQQHEDLKQELLSTGDAELVEVSCNRSQYPLPKFDVFDIGLR